MALLLGAAMATPGLEGLSEDLEGITAPKVYGHALERALKKQEPTAAVVDGPVEYPTMKAGTPQVVPIGTKESNFGLDKAGRLVIRSDAFGINPQTARPPQIAGVRQSMFESAVLVKKNMEFDGRGNDDALFLMFPTNIKLSEVSPSGMDLNSKTHEEVAKTLMAKWNSDADGILARMKSIIEQLMKIKKEIVETPSTAFLDDLNQCEDNHFLNKEQASWTEAVHRVLGQLGTIKNNNELGKMVLSYDDHRSPDNQDKLTFVPRPEMVKSRRFPAHDMRTYGVGIRRGLNKRDVPTHEDYDNDLVWVSVQFGDKMMNRQSSDMFSDLVQRIPTGGTPDEQEKAKKELDDDLTNMKSVLEVQMKSYDMAMAQTGGEIGATAPLAAKQWENMVGEGVGDRSVTLQWFGDSISHSSGFTIGAEIKFQA